MVGSAERALRFVRDLTESTRPYWNEEVAALEAFAKTLGLEDLEPWDVSFVAERLRQRDFDFDEEELRAWHERALRLLPQEGVDSRCLVALPSLGELSPLQIDGANAHHQRIFHRLAEHVFVAQSLLGQLLGSDVTAGQVQHAGVRQRADGPPRRHRR